MAVRDSVGDQLGRARDFVANVRKKYEQAYAKAMEAGKDGLGGLVKASESLPPRVKSVVTHAVGTAENLIDNINQNLAQRAVPDFRKSGIKSSDHGAPEQKVAGGDDSAAPVKGVKKKKK